MKVIFARPVFITLVGKSLPQDSKSTDITEFQLRTMFSNIQREPFVICLSNQWLEIARIIFQGRLDREVSDGNWFNKTTF